MTNGFWDVLDARTGTGLSELAARGPKRDAKTEETVANILADVLLRGDAALLDVCRQFDCSNLEELRVTATEIDEAEVAPEVDAALDHAIRRVTEFHVAQAHEFGLGAGTTRTWGAEVGQQIRPLARVGVYVPGGAAAYPSSVLMNVLPAVVAGVGEVIVTTPSRADGTLEPAVLVALRKTGVRTAFKVGGAAAIASLAFGTESVPRVDKIVGPGNRFVNEAKRQVWGRVGLDGYAGPSEVCLVIDDSSDPVLAAADLLTQLEHAPDNAGFLISESPEAIAAVHTELHVRLELEPRREILDAALDRNGRTILVQDRDHALEAVNLLAAEHVTVAVREADTFAVGVVNGGCILIGEFSAESAGDYLAGPSHTLPTAGAARWQSPVNVLDFIKIQSRIALDRAAMAALAEDIRVLAELEGFPAHARGATLRSES
jgi:histidinol dehydrogenase